MAPGGTKATASSDGCWVSVRDETLSSFCGSPPNRTSQRHAWSRDHRDARRRLYLIFTHLRWAMPCVSRAVIPHQKRAECRTHVTVIHYKTSAWRWGFFCAVVGYVCLSPVASPASGPRSSWRAVPSGGYHDQPGLVSCPETSCNMFNYMKNANYPSLAKSVTPVLVWPPGRGPGVHGCQ